MYLCDRDIRQKIAQKELIIACEGNIRPLDINEQITPCSIDLRLSNMFWKANRKVIDIKNPFNNDSSHSVYWKKITLGNDECVVLRPGESILGRTHESFTIPLDCAGKIESKSGFNRLMISVTLGDFCNPGFVGHYPLQIQNLGTHTIKLYPYISICQLILVRLSGETDKKYQDNTTSNYLDGVGGPSRFWADKIIRKIKHETYGKILENVDEIERYTSAENLIPVIRKFERFFKQQKGRIAEGQILSQFEKVEKVKCDLAKIFAYLIPAAMLACVGFSFVRFLDIITSSLGTGSPINIAVLLVYIICIVGSIAIGLFVFFWLKRMVFYVPQKK